MLFIHHEILRIKMKRAKPKVSPYDFLSLLSDSNQRPRDYKSRALPEITNHVLWPTELKRRVGKRSASRRYNQLPLLRPSPGGFEGSWPYRTFPFASAKVYKTSETSKHYLNFFISTHIFFLYRISFSIHYKNVIFPYEVRLFHYFFLYLQTYNL